MAHKIKDIKEILAAISKNRGDFQLEVRREETRLVVRAREHTHSYIPQENVIGRESDKISILQLLLDPKHEENVFVVPIVGCGGLGKTTLAQLVFNDKEVQTKFDLRIWVCVSNDFNVRSLVERIIKSVTDQSLGNLEMDQLQKELQKQINGKRYFLVLDDVWNENRELWISLQNLLSNGAKGSRILITTRSKVVGEITSTMEPYMLGLLDKGNSWSLFKKVAFKSGQEPNNSNTVKTAMEIVEKCGGIPLAIRTIGSMLYSKNPETEWSNFLEIEFSRIPQNENDILPTLKLSYDSLPSHLKNCFAYCRLFPKDHAIEVDMLIKLWMAQGFLTSSSSIQSLEDVGNEYFKDLHWRSFFQEVEENLSTKRLECKMHDLMHDLAIQVAGTECATLHSTEENINERTRHVSFDFHLETSGKIPTSLSRKSKIRTTLFPQKSWESNKLSWDDILLNFKLLRTLDLHDSELKMVPKSIGKLKHLRYLDLSENGDIKRLPNSITKLQNLLTLKLSYCGDLVELPRDLKKLVNLRHLENHGCDSLTHMPSGLGQLTYLHTLNEFVVKKGIDSTGKQHNRHVGGLNELMELNNLRGELFIRNLGYGEDASIEYKDAKLKEKQHLHHLKLHWPERSGDHVDAREAADYEITLESLQPHANLKELSLIDYKGVRLASWLPSLTTLDTLLLAQCEKIENVLPLRQLPCLKSLQLVGLSSLEYISDNNNVSSDLLASQEPLMSNLQSLELRALPNLKGWWKDHHVEEEDDSCCSLPLFACLSRLVIEDCPKLTSMPLYPHLKEQLVLVKASLKSFQQTLMMSTADSSFSPLSNLTSILLSGIQHLQSLPEELTRLTSLETLYIIDCPKLKTLCPAILHLTFLQNLMISDCQEVDICDNGDGNMWQALQSLDSLQLYYLPQLETLPDGLQQLTSLRLLSLDECKSLVSIPEWIGNLKSLQMLDISACNNLKSLPQGIQQLTSLQALSIMDCPVLKQRCERGGEDWHKVAHIPYLSLA
nr:putative disease resistance protein RGA3 [Ziziphus jujuba var. spinosa]XP_048333078.1 putative disease resistance protein RGA3 [Ziziphus jujuba var. spinosa]XP_048333079.1 putative disease resistance protein RGA3 [Ziziphus jujuba var. spinosa]